jgi:3-oxoacyl-[acyl-carrier protein] reductase
VDLGIRGRHAIVCGASEGLGRACAEALAADGVQLVICARREGPLEKAAGEIRETHGVSVKAIACDITTEAGRTAILAVSDETDILVNNAGGPPPGNFREWDRDQWIAALDANMLSPIEMIKALIDGMIERRFGRIINITSGSVKSPIPELGLSNGARTGLTGFVAGLARQVAKHNVTINGLLPGEFATARLYKLSQARAEGTAKTAEEILAERAQRNPAGRQGDPTEFGAACAFLCSAHAGYITGQNILMDGGSFNSSI